MTTNNRPAMAVAAAGVCLLAWLGAAVVRPCVDAMAGAGRPPAHAEDDPGWDCRTMGNLVCGGRP